MSQMDWKTFLQESQMMKKIDHPHIYKVFDVFESN